MRLKEAVAQAEKINREVVHPNLNGGKPIPPKKLKTLAIPYSLIDSDQWSVRVDSRKVSTESFEEVASKVLAKHIRDAKARQVILSELETALFP